MMENGFTVVKDGPTLTIELGKELTTANAPALTEELSKYCGQGIEKVVFDATGLNFLTSSGIRTIFFAYQKLGGKPEIVFANCAQEIYDVLDYVGLTSVIKFETSMEMRKNYRRKLSELDHEKIEQQVRERREALENYGVHNDVVCYSMKLGQED